jgi:hypothetical protein
MQENNGGAAPVRNYKEAGISGEAILKLFKAYFHDHIHTGKLYEDFPSFFLFKPGVLEGREIASRNSEKLLLFYTGRHGAKRFYWRIQAPQSQAGILLARAFGVAVHDG